MKESGERRTGSGEVVMRDAVLEGLVIVHGKSFLHSLSTSGIGLSLS